MSKNQDYFIKPRVFSSGKKTVDELLREQKKRKNNETLNNIKNFPNLRRSYLVNYILNHFCFMKTINGSC